MKGTVFLKPLEYNIEALGERWRQGDKVSGKIRIKNHSVDNLTLPLLAVTLCSGHYKKIKTKDKKAWEVLDRIIAGESISLNAQEEKEFSFEFSLSGDCRITDKDGSLYLNIETKEEDSWPAGHMELVIEPKLILQQVLEIFENFIRFKVNQIKYSKGMMEVKLLPPKSRELSHVESLVLRMSEVDNNLSLNYLFNLQVLDMAGGTMTAQKKTRDFEQKFTRKQFTIYGDSINQDFIIDSVNSVLKEIKPKLLM